MKTWRIINYALCIPNSALSLPKVLLVLFYPLLHRYLLHQLSDEFVGDVVHFFEPDASFAHIQFCLAGGFIFCREPVGKGFIGIDAKVVKRDEVLLRTQVHKGKRELRVGMVAFWIDRMRHNISQHSVTDRCFKPFREVCHNRFMKSFHRRLARLGER
jgi:hypothetical protein